MSLLEAKTDNEAPTALTPPPDYLCKFSEYVCSSVTAPIDCAGIYYGGTDEKGNDVTRPEDPWVLLAFSRLIQAYLG